MSGEKEAESQGGGKAPVARRPHDAPQEPAGGSAPSSSHVKAGGRLAGGAPATAPASTPAPAPAPRLFTAVFLGIVGVTLFCYVTGQGLNAGTSVYIDRLGGSATLAGIGAAVFSAAAIVGRLVSGLLADTRGRLLVMVTGAIVLIAGVVGAAVSASLDLAMLWRTLQGLGFSAVTTAAATAAADVLPVERLGEGIGYYGLGQALAMSVGPAIAIALVATDPAENLFWGLAVAAAVSLALCVLCRYERDPERLPESATYRRLAEKAARDAASAQKEAAAKGQSAQAKGEREHGAKAFLHAALEPGALAGGIPLMVISPAFGFGIFFVGLLGTQLGVGNAGLFYTLSAVSMIVVRISSKAFMDRVLPIKLFSVAVASGVVCYALLLVVTLGVLADGGRDAVFYLAGIFYGLCLGLTLPVNQTVAVKNSPAERWGAANGLFLLMIDLGIGLASIVWGITNDTLGFSFTICFVIALIVASLGVAWLTYPPAAKRRR